MNRHRPKLIAPPGMCDTHMHCYDSSIPSAPGGPPLPGHYSVPMYRELQQRLGMSRVHPFGWYANIQLDGRDLPKYEAQIKRLPGKFVIDHVGKFLEPVAPEHEAFRSMLRLLDTGRCWVKLAAYYETSKTGAPNYEDVARLAKALIRHAPDRMIWGSNWPHPSAPADNKPDDADLLDLLLDWVADDATRRKILADNPAELFGFANA
jgi:D-galactarolactone isomerase